MKAQYALIKASGLFVVFLSLLTGVVQAQFTYTTNNGVITITGYNGPGGLVTIPATLTVTNLNNSVTNLPVRYVGQNAFQNLSSITGVIIASNVVSLGTNAFASCRNLASLGLTNGVTSLAQNAFELCTSLTSASIPATVTNIGPTVFGGCQSLLAINVDAANAFYSSTNGVLFNKSQTVLIQFPGGVAGAYTIPATVTNLAPLAFAGPAALNSVVIPGSVDSVGYEVFDDNRALTNVVLLSGVGGIAQGAFYDCENLSSVTLPGTITNLGYAAFGRCYSLSSIAIPGSLATIGQNAFDLCYSLTNVTIADGVAKIAEWAFYDCTNLASLTVPASVTNLASQAFYGCTMLGGVYFMGDAPAVSADTFANDTNAILYYLPETGGWTNPLGNCPTVLWNPQVQTGDGQFGVLNNQFGFNVTGTTNIPIVVQATANLTQPSWMSLLTCNITNGSVHFSDQQWMNYPSRFYRIRSP